MSQRRRMASHAPARRTLRASVTLASYATPFQAYVPGVGIRVDIVGKEVYVCGIVSDADDDRYAAFYRGLRGQRCVVGPLLGDLQVARFHTRIPARLIFASSRAFE